MSRHERHVLPLLFLSLVVLTAAAGPVFAHEGAFAPVGQPAATDTLAWLSAAPELGTRAHSALPGALALGALAAAVLDRRHRRVVVAMALAAAVAAFGFEDALHSVHHGFDPAETKGCLIAVATAHVVATAVDAVAFTDLVTLQVEDRHVRSEPTRPTIDLPRSDQGRAPPA